MQVDSGPQSISFSVATSAAWFAATPIASATPTSLRVSLNPVGLPTGSYAGTVTLTPATGLVRTFPISLEVLASQLAAPELTAVVNSASQTLGPLAPGEIVTIYGSGLGPSIGQGPILATPNTIGILNSGSRIWFGNIAAPILFTSTGQINALVPYELLGTVSVQAEFDGRRSPPRDIVIGLAAPAIFTQNASGRGNSAILNQDYSLNTPAHPAARGSVVMIYATGGGQTSPSSTTGQIAGPNPVNLALSVTVTIAGRLLEAIYAGTAPGLVTGLVQLNVILPPDIQIGTALPVSITIGGVTSPEGPTLSIE